MNELIKNTMQNLELNNIEAIYAETKEEVVPLIEKLVAEGTTVAVGGSVTLDETGVLEHLRCGRYNFLDRYAEGLSGEDIMDIYRKSFAADVYFCSSNAITQSGCLYNVDGNGNRVAAITYGPKNVIIIAGVNKIVKDIDEAVKRVREIAAPLNCKRLNRNTYCFEKGHCVAMNGEIGEGCKSPQRICRQFVTTAKQAQLGRIKVILVNENLGY